MSYLGWDGTGDVRDWFTTNEVDLEAAWLDTWIQEGSGGGWADIYTAYDWPEDIRALALKLDTFNSTANTLVIYMWCISWGMDAQIVRYLEKANITRTIFQNWMEDMYLNISIGPSMSNTTLRATANYHLGLWEDDDPNVWMSGWSIEAQHMDWCGNTATHNSYPSPYNLYDPDQYPLDEHYRISRVPWTTHFGNYVSYWVAPLEHDLADGDTIIVQAPSTDVICFRPGKSTSDTETAFRTNLKNNEYWGTMVLSKGGNYPQSEIEKAYDPVTKTITLVGPLDIPSLKYSWGGLQFGMPSIMFDVSPVAYYEISNDLVGGEYTPGVQFNITVTAKNGTGVTVTGWNGSVDLSAAPSAKVAFGSAHLTFNGTSGVVSTTVIVTRFDNVAIIASDSLFPKDIVGTDVVHTSVVYFPPTGSIVINSGEAFTNSTACVLTLMASSNVTQMRFSNDNATWSAWETFATSKNWDLGSGDGTKTVYAEFLDKYGVSVFYNDSIVLDSTAPTTSIASKVGTLGNNSWYRSEVTVTLNASDATSGVNTTKYRIGVGAWQTYSGSFTVGTEGINNISFYSVDNVGNAESLSSISIKIDSVAPSSVAEKSGSTVSISASDATSGVAITYYRIDGGAWQEYSAAFEVTEAGNHTVEYYSIDVAGNAESKKTIYVENAVGADMLTIGLTIIVIIIIIAIIVALMMKRKKEPKKEESEEQKSK
ncbi:MAG: hypothetical protein QXY98_05495 [Thermoplasmata archaeon]